MRERGKKLDRRETRESLAVVHSGHHQKDKQGEANNLKQKRGEKEEKTDRRGDPAVARSGYRPATRFAVSLSRSRRREGCMLQACDKAQMRETRDWDDGSKQR
ncbi:2,3-diphosphoglycerate-dependent phosphoglycerate mutase [Sesbania bispinosa]|nr:2,3-diphosphoglycerate-dependent phosphoglycerate mutase [Sesbania bispinosa]